MILQGALYIVATPIGHLEDITLRARQILSAVDRIAAEDTRHSLHLLKHLGIEKPVVSLHEHNEKEKALKLLEPLQQGASLALISDAGTPLISDPGYHLVRLAHEQDIKVVPIPGACALIVALCASGLATDKFVFEGFLSAKPTSRHKQLENLIKETRTLIFFEAPHRVLATLETMRVIFGDQRQATLARELTKTFETIRHATLRELWEWVSNHPMQQRGEFVILLAGASKPVQDTLSAETQRILKRLLAELPLKQATRLAADITGIPKGLLYEEALALKRASEL